MDSSQDLHSGAYSNGDTRSSRRNEISSSGGSPSQTQFSNPRPYGRSDLGVNVPNYHQLLSSQGMTSSPYEQFNSHSGLYSQSGSQPTSDGNSTGRSGYSTSGSDSNTTSTFHDDYLQVREGTNIKPREAMQLFFSFFRNFRLFEDPNAYYIVYLKNILTSSNTVFNLDVSHLHLFPNGDQLFEALVYFPTSTIPLVDFVVNQLANEIRNESGSNQPQIDHRDNQSDDNLQSGDIQHEKESYHPYPIIVRPYGLELMNSRSLAPSDIDGLVSLRGIVLRVSTLKPELKLAMFPCNTQGCDNIITQEVNDGRLRQPTYCTTCNKRDSFYLAHNLSRYASKQIIRIQEVPEDITDGETPHTISICAYDELVDAVKPGDRIIVTGIFRGQNIRLNPQKRAVQSNLFTYIDAFHFRMVSAATKTKGQSTQHSELHQGIGIGLDSNQNRTDSTISGNQTHGIRDGFTKDDTDLFHAFSERSDLYQLLARSIAPSVWGLDDVKKGLLAMLVGGNNLDGDASSSSSSGDHGANDDGQKRGKRGVVHVLLVGDPGTAKSQLLQYIHKLTTRGVYTSGTASSAAGLTASVMRDPIQNEAVLEPGALVLSDCDICCIDEFDKMSAGAQSILHEAMEQQTVSIAKSGVICSLSARTTILASANPRDSRYNPNLSVVKNIDLSPTLLSRFDLIYIVLDTPHPQSDERLAEHLLSLFMSDQDRAILRHKNAERIHELIGELPTHTNSANVQITLPQNDSGEEYIPTTNLLSYINYARTIIPIFNHDACIELENCYLALRGSTNDIDSGEMGGSILDPTNTGSGNVDTISATPRQLQSLIRISESLAKLHLKDIVTPQHVREASRLIRTATLAAALDPTTGKIDMSALNTGQSASEKLLVSRCADHIMDLYARDVSRKLVAFNEVCDFCIRQNQNNTPEIVTKSLQYLNAEEKVEWSPGTSHVRYM
jgi:DNA replication licensing factor MCM4